MKNKMMIIMYSVLLAVSVLGFTTAKQGPAPNVLVPDDSDVMGQNLNVLEFDPNILVNERSDQKAIFDYHEGIYNNNANTQVRAQDLADKNKKADDQAKQKVEEAQDKTKGQFLWKF